MYASILNFPSIIASRCHIILHLDLNGRVELCKQTILDKIELFNHFKSNTYNNLKSNITTNNTQTHNNMT